MPPMRPMIFTDAPSPSIDELPGVRSIETAYPNTLLKAWIEVVEVHTMPSTRARSEWLPVRHAPAGVATHRAQRLVSPDVPSGVFRVAVDPNRSKLVVHPESTKPPAEGAVALSRLLGCRRQ